MRNLSEKFCPHKTSTRNDSAEPARHRRDYIRNFTKADSAPDGALFFVTKVENGETKTYYGTEDADFSTDNLSEATAIELLGDLTVKTAFSTSATISINKDIIFKLTKTLTYEGTGTAIKVNAGKLTLSGSSTIIKSIQDDVTIIEIAENAELKVQKSSSTATISNSDKSNCIGIKSSGKVTIGDSAEIHLGGSGSVGVESNGELIVSGTSCKINGKKYGVNITGGTLTASKGTIQNSATDSEASIKISNKNVTATISGVTVGNSSSKAANALVIANDSKSSEVSKVYIAGNSTFHSSGDAILNNDSSVKIAASATDSNVYSINIDGYTRFYDSADKMNTAINGAQAYITTDTIADEDSLDPTKTDPTKTKY